MDWILLFFRIVIGGLFIMHGLDKFKEQNAKNMIAWFTMLKLKHPQLSLVLARAAEVWGGALVIIGISYSAPIVLIIVMLSAIRLAHWKSDPRVTNGGWEYCAVMIASLLVLLGTGYGAFSIHALLGLPSR